MSEQEQSKSFMQELDQWVEGAVISPLVDGEAETSLEDTIAGVKEAILTKVLESYRNGLAAGPSRAPREAYKPRGR